MSSCFQIKHGELTKYFSEKWDITKLLIIDNDVVLFLCRNKDVKTCDSSYSVYFCRSCNILTTNQSSYVHLFILWICIVLGSCYS